MEKKKELLTQKALEELKKKHDHLVNVERPQVQEELAAARAQGDLSENADYDAARDRQARIESEIRDAEAILSNYEIIDENKSKVVRGKKVVIVGSTVVIHDEETNEENELTILGAKDADPFEGKISNDTPLAMAILDHKEGDVVVVNTAKPYKVRIVTIK